jgi:hypothetical protein
VTQSPQTITFGALSNLQLSSSPFTVAATASSGLTVKFHSYSPLKCSVSGTTVTLLAVGTCIIEATQPGNSSYAAAVPVKESFFVTPYGQTITFGALPNQPLSTPPFTVTATSSSGLTVKFHSYSPLKCSVSGTTVTLLAVGTCIIEATQPGNASYASAAPVKESFQIHQ